MEMRRMDLYEYRKDFLESAKALAAESGEGTVASFVRVAADTLRDAEVIPDYESCFFVGTGKKNRKLRVDAYALDDFDWTITLMAAEYQGHEGQTLKMTNAKQVFERLLAFIDEAHYGNLHHEIEMSTPVYDLVDVLRSYADRIRKYRLILLTDQVASERMGNFPDSELKGIPVEYHVWDMGRFFRVYGSDDGREELEISLRDYSSDGIPCLEASSAKTEEYRSFLCVIPGDVLTKIYDRYGSRLLEGNVRSFLSTKVAVNKAIRTTVLSDPTKFFAFNNGIAATATEVVTEERPTGRVITHLKGLQIVNGGQTTATLSTVKYKEKADLSRVFVQMKLTEVDSGLAETIIPQISRSSNSQNKVSEADFFSNHPFHIRVEQLSKRMFAPAIGGTQYETHWFYERARGQYLQAQAKMTKSEKNKFMLQNPKKQLITKTDLAKFCNTWRGYPQKVSLGAQKNFLHFAEWITKEWAKRDADFNEAFFQESIALAIVFRHVERLVSIQPWYEKGYRANIVTYTVALLGHVLRVEYPDKILNLHDIWNKQAVPDVLDRQLVIISKFVFDVLTSSDRQVQNVTEWSKRDTCWNRMQELKISLLPKLGSLMISKEDGQSSQRSARKQQAIITGIEAQMYVVGLGSQYWTHMLQWAQDKRLLAVEESKLLNLACKMSGTSLPNAVQSRKLQELRNRLIAEGFQQELEEVLQ